MLSFGKKTVIGTVLICFELFLLPLQFTLGSSITFSNDVWEQIGGDIDGDNANDEFGSAVVLSKDGQRVAIGSSLNGYYRGHVRILQLVRGVWYQVGNPIEGDESSTLGAAVSLSDDGNILAVGAPEQQLVGNFTGYARVFRFQGSDWNQFGEDILGDEFLDVFGKSVSLSGNGLVVAIGANGNDANGLSSGLVRVLSYDGSGWDPLGDDIFGEEAGDESGISVSLSTDGAILAIGAQFNEGDNECCYAYENERGNVRVFEFEDSSEKWQQLGSSINGESTFDFAGYSVSLSSDGTMIAIGSYASDDNGDQSGHTRIFEYKSNDWIQLGSDIEGETAGDYSGESVSLSSNGGRVAMGATSNVGGGANGSYRGHARVFEYTASDDDWVQVGLDIDGESDYEYSGISVSISGSGERVAIGALGAGYYSGKVRVYEYPLASDSPSVAPSLAPTNVTCDTILGFLLGIFSRD